MRCASTPAIVATGDRAAIGGARGWAVGGDADCPASAPISALISFSSFTMPFSLISLSCALSGSIEACETPAASNSRMVSSSCSMRPAGLDTMQTDGARGVAPIGRLSRGATSGTWRQCRVGRSASTTVRSSITRIASRRI
eukprot:5324506-Prymnesium_polylepis.1